MLAEKYEVKLAFKILRGHLLFLLYISFKIFAVEFWIISSMIDRFVKDV